MAWSSEEEERQVPVSGDYFSFNNWGLIHKKKIKTRKRPTSTHFFPSCARVLVSFVFLLLIWMKGPSIIQEIINTTGGPIFSLSKKKRIHWWWIMSLKDPPSTVDSSSSERELRGPTYRINRRCRCWLIGLHDQQHLPTSISSSITFSFIFCRRWNVWWWRSWSSVNESWWNRSSFFLMVDGRPEGRWKPSWVTIRKTKRSSIKDS